MCVRPIYFGSSHTPFGVYVLRISLGTGVYFYFCLDEPSPVHSIQHTRYELQLKSRTPENTTPQTYCSAHECRMWYPLIPWDSSSMTVIAHQLRAVVFTFLLIAARPVWPQVSRLKHLTIDIGQEVSGLAEEVKRKLWRWASLDSRTLLLIRDHPRSYPCCINSPSAVIFRCPSPV